MQSSSGRLRNLQYAPKPPRSFQKGPKRLQNDLQEEEQAFMGIQEHSKRFKNLRKLAQDAVCGLRRAKATLHAITALHIFFLHRLSPENIANRMIQSQNLLCA